MEAVQTSGGAKYCTPSQVISQHGPLPRKVYYVSGVVVVVERSGRNMGRKAAKSGGGWCYPQNALTKDTRIDVATLRCNRLPGHPQVMEKMLEKFDIPELELKHVKSVSPQTWCVMRGGHSE